MIGRYICHIYGGILSYVAVYVRDTVEAGARSRGDNSVRRDDADTIVSVIRNVYIPLPIQGDTRGRVQRGFRGGATFSRKALDPVAGYNCDCVVSPQSA